MGVNRSWHPAAPWRVIPTVPRFPRAPLSALLFAISALLLLPGPLSAQPAGRTQAPEAREEAERRAGDRVLAVVNRRIFTERDMDFWMLEYRLNRTELFDVPDDVLRPDLLSDAVDDFLLRSWAELEFDQEIPSEVIEGRYRAALERFQRLAGGARQFDALLEQLAIDPYLFRRWLRDQAYSSMIIREGVTAQVVAGGQTPFDGSVRTAHRLRLAHLLVEANMRRESERERAYERALRIRRDIAAGLPFAEAARLHSDDSATAPIGGDLGWFTEGAINEDLWEAARSVRRGLVPPPVETANGYHLIIVQDYETPEQREYLRRVREFENRRLIELRRSNDIRLADGYALLPLPETPDALDSEPTIWEMLDLENEEADSGGGPAD